MSQMSSPSECFQVFVPASVHTAWQFLKGFPVDEEELALQGVTALAGIEFEDQLIDLPETLETWRHLWPASGLMGILNKLKQGNRMKQKYTKTIQNIYELYDRRKFRSQTSDNMDR